MFRRATDGSVENLNATLPITEFEWGIAGEADADGPIFGGTQDTTTVLRMANGSWRAMSCSDGGAVAWRASVPNTIIAACFTDLITKSTNGGTTFDEAGWFDLKSKEDPGEFFNFHPPLVMDPSDAQRLYFASTRVWRTTDGASTWNPISAHFGSDAGYAVQALGVTTSQDVLYAGTNNGRAGADDERHGRNADVDADAGERASQPDVHRDPDEAGRSRHGVRDGERLRSEPAAPDTCSGRPTSALTGRTSPRTSRTRRSTRSRSTGAPRRRRCTRRPMSASSGHRTAG